MRRQWSWIVSPEFSIEIGKEVARTNPRKTRTRGSQNPNPRHLEQLTSKTDTIGVFGKTRFARESLTATLRRRKFLQTAKMTTEQTEQEEKYLICGVPDQRMFRFEVLQLVLDRLFTPLAAAPPSSTWRSFLSRVESVCHLALGALISS